MLLLIYEKHTDLVNVGNEREVCATFELGGGRKRNESL